MDRCNGNGIAAAKQADVPAADASENILLRWVTEQLLAHGPAVEAVDIFVRSHERPIHLLSPSADVLLTAAAIDQAPLSACAKDVQGLLADVGQRMLLKEIDKELNRSTYRYSERTLQRAVKELVDRGIADNPRHKRGYGFVGWA